jgi:O-antigen ligase/polysaccharide polymerase Wzy-like membrane protein
MTLTGLAFVLAFFGALGLAVVRQPIYGLYAYVAVFYLHPPSRWWGAFLPDLRWSLLAGIVTLVLVLRLPSQPDRRPWYGNTAAKVLIAYTVWLWIQNLWALDGAEQMSISILFTKYVVLFYLFYRLVDNPTDLRRLLWVHFAGCVYLGWLAFNSDSGGRLEGVGGPGIDEANALAMQLDTGVAVGAMLLLTGNKYERIASLLGMPFVLNGIVLTGSRGAFLAILFAGVVLALMKPHQYRKTFYALGALGLVLFSILASQMFWERMGTMSAAVDDTEQMDTSAESRFAIAEAQWRMTLRYPFGSGHRGTAVLSKEYIDAKYLTNDPSVEQARSSHNTFMTALSEQGFIGAFMFLLSWAWCAKTSLKLRRKFADPRLAGDVAGVAAALAAIFLAGMFVDYLKAEVQVWAMSLLAAAAAMTVRKPVAEATAAKAGKEQSAAQPLSSGAQRR